MIKTDHGLCPCLLAFLFPQNNNAAKRSETKKLNEHLQKNDLSPGKGFPLRWLLIPRILERCDILLQALTINKYELSGL